MWSRKCKLIQMGYVYWLEIKRRTHYFPILSFPELWNQSLKLKKNEDLEMKTFTGFCVQIMLLVPVADSAMPISDPSVGLNLKKCVLKPSLRPIFLELRKGVHESQNKFLDIWSIWGNVGSYLELYEITHLHQ